MPFCTGGCGGGLCVAHEGEKGITNQLNQCAAHYNHADIIIMVINQQSLKTVGIRLVQSGRHMQYVGI